MYTAKKSLVWLLMLFVILAFVSNNVSDDKEAMRGTAPIQTTSTSTETPTVISTDFPESEDKHNFLLSSDNTNADRNRLLIEDIDYLGEQLSVRHPNPFGKTSRQEFEGKIDTLKQKVNEWDDLQVIAEMQRIVASIGDAHTFFWHGTNWYYPITFGLFGKDYYVINAGKGYKDLLYAKLLSINQNDITYIQEQLKPLISYENHYWVGVQMTQWLSTPTILEGVGLIWDFKSPIIFTFESMDGVIFNQEITPVFEDDMDLCLSVNDPKNVYLFRPDLEKDYYWYEYLEQDRTVYFQYNACYENKDLPFRTFNDNMFEDVNGKTVDKFVIDLRHNGGGNFTVINPFLWNLSQYMKANPSLAVFVIMGNKTFSAGLNAALDIKNVSKATLIGEPTGGSPDSYAEVAYFTLPNSKMAINYSTQRFYLPVFNAKNDGGNTILPDIEIIPTIDDCIKNDDIVMDYIHRLKQ